MYRSFKTSSNRPSLPQGKHKKILNFLIEITDKHEMTKIIKASEFTKILRSA